MALSAGLRLDQGLPQTALLDLAGYCLLFEETTRQSGYAGWACPTGGISPRTCWG
ncbi:hypothetical protein RAA17_21720 [Komagataeibacter rhaeticus]|nr:hypothetical protein [Komagataeibacter rhaeticus]